MDLFALPKHKAYKISIANNYFLQKAIISFDRRQFKTNKQKLEKNKQKREKLPPFGLKTPKMTF